MALPVFFSEDISAQQNPVVLEEDTSKHVVQVLRMQEGEQLQLTDGKGNIFVCEIAGAHKKKCAVVIKSSSYEERKPRKISIAISLLKNTNRFEWFLEKATELGITEIIPMICERTEKQHFRFDRMKNILISALLQSQQSWLPEMSEPVSFESVINKSIHAQKFIAHCADGAKVALADAANSAIDSQIILIGPEGDFSEKEISLSFQHHFTAVALGETRLRTETAGIVAATLLVNC
ncbi:MAG: 16S rRNA (uracil(1498)-N(3))-methyltransferase [Bacteroidetes bacterium]|nr:16S rRNA (uracil(1498)-N(3))-methyltransferase [Bacteroidota bacterium]